MRVALIRSASTSVRPPAVGCVCSPFCASLPPRQLPLHNPLPPPPAIERMRDDARAAGRGSLTRTVLAAVVRCVDSLISGRQARSVRSTPSGSPMRAALIRLASTSVRPPAVGCVCSLSCAFLQSSSSTNRQAGCPPTPAGCACAMIARARWRCGDGTGMIPNQWFKPLPPDPSGSYPRREDARA
ncbi:hypothetical protein EVAR_103037_1 [Eumeta japonica]|uniref:Uncharacterized protein n=1 Tax=Eumeta variegata TaxID=151549 RepID=A0A4C1WDY6_EUMVA|nr:hypothetical protein EVAR_103037_1 [Eumeta japonica]